MGDIYSTSNYVQERRYFTGKLNENTPCRAVASRSVVTRKNG